MEIIKVVGNSLIKGCFYVVLPTIAVVFLLRKYRERSWGVCKSTKSLTGQICIVTGANSGIGKEVAKDLARRNATVILACRNLESAQEEIKDIRKNIKSGELIPYHLDLSSLESVRQFANKIIEDFPEINILVLNAGIWSESKEPSYTDDAFELHMGVNHLGHFLLTNLLLPKLNKSKSCRVVSVSSTLHERGLIDSNNLNYIKSEASSKRQMNPAYCNSKLANALFSQELAIRAPNISTYAVCPGFTFTRLFRDYNTNYFKALGMIPIIIWFMRSATQGAQTVIHCCVSEEVEGETGLFYRDCQRYDSKADLNSILAHQVWETSEKMVGLTVTSSDK